MTLTEPDFERVVADGDDAELSALLDGHGEAVLAELFRRMPEHLDPEAAADVDMVVEWRIAPVSDGAPARFQTAIRDRECTVLTEHERPQVKLRMAILDFVRLVTGRVDGMDLVTSGRLTVQGDIGVAALVPTLFRLPGQDEFR
jgi:hypothetical protein